MSKIEVNTVEPQCGTTLTLGGSGDTVTLGSGASQSGFGRTGTVDWQTSIKTGDFTATSGEGYFVNTTSGAITVTLPASPSAGDIVSVKDYAQTFDTNACTIGRNSQPIEGQTFDLILDTEGTAITLIYGDATKGWQSVNSNEVTNAQKFITATGGTITTVCTNFKVHTFTGPGTFSVTCAGNPAGSTQVDYLVVAGGGAGGSISSGGGGGAGGYRESPGSASGCYSVSPRGAAPATAITVTVQDYPITVGAGGTTMGNPAGNGNPGGTSTFSTITSAGGGAGKANPAPCTTGSSGGSGGGGGGPGAGGAGNTPPVNPAQGTNGNTGAGADAGGGGGGAICAGGPGSGPSGAGVGGNGGAGATSSINGTPTARAGGGGGRGGGTRGNAGTGGGGQGAQGSSGVANGTANTGGGGGGSGSSGTAGTGGSGIVIIRYKFQ